jgi:ankyrin repeat protein
MARALPARPNLDWLRKAAKQALHDLRAQRPEARLADAQLAVARDHGFSSWRALKAHVDAQQRILGGVDDEAIAQFLRDVRSGAAGAVRAALIAAPALVNAPGPHPHWGGRPQPLQMAIEGKTREVFDLLLAAGADVNARGASYEHWSPLMLTEGDDTFGMRAELLKRGATIGLAEALLLGDDRRLDEILRGGRQVIAKRAPGGGSWLILARTVHAIDRLLALGVPIDKPDVWQTTPVETYSRLGARGQVLLRHLVQRGARASPAEFARLGDREMLASLIDADARIARDDEVFMAAIDSGNVDLVEWLLEKGANANARTRHGSQCMALHGAAWQGNLRMAQLLVAAGADVTGRDVEHRNTPAGYARVSLRITKNPACIAVAEYLEGLETSRA